VLDNLTDSSLHVVDVEVYGEGIPSVVSTKRVEVALEPGPGEGRVPGGWHKIYPPAFPTGTRCNVQRLVSATGFDLEPRQYARLAVWLRAATPGDFFVRGQRITYEKDGDLYQQSLPVGMKGEVRPNARPLQLLKDERACLGVARKLAGPE
ncbi:MAG: hypothetical protein M3238_08270, partial [Actinomycetota bacterium]|nr:hypothetical protein [Actinomycetota bacterium]